MARRWGRKAPAEVSVAIDTSITENDALRDVLVAFDKGFQRTQGSGLQDYRTSQDKVPVDGSHRDPKTGELMDGPGIHNWKLFSSGSSPFEGIEGRHCDPWGAGEADCSQSADGIPMQNSYDRQSKMHGVRQGQGIEEALSKIGAEAGSRQENVRSSQGYCPTGEQQFSAAERHWTTENAKSLESGTEDQHEFLSHLPLDNLHSLHSERLAALHQNRALAPVLPSEAKVESAASQRNQRRARRRAEQREPEVIEGVAEQDLQGGCIALVRDDCRLHDNPCLHAASTAFSWTIPLYVHDDNDPSPLPLRGAGLYWRHMSLLHYSQALAKCHGTLIIRRGDYIEEVLDVLLASGAKAVYFNRQLEPWYHQRDLDVERKLLDLGYIVKSFKGMVLQREPWEHAEKARPAPHMLTKYQGAPNQADNKPEGAEQASPSVGDQLVEPPLAAVTHLGISAPPCVSGLSLASLGYGLSAGKGFPLGNSMTQHNKIREEQVSQGILKRDTVNDWAYEMRQFWSFGEQGGLNRLEDFLVEVAAGHYQPPDRYRADKQWTALLSPYLRFGDLSPRYVYDRARQTLPFFEWKPLVRRLFWRDGAYAQLYRWPESASRSIREQYESEKWNGTEAMLRSWQHGRTGFPLIDAAMRQLWKVGWMPNYLRHVTAQFLIEYLDVNWKEGLKWYDYTLVDSDVAINAMMWQMGGHSGLGAWNFVMHPVFAGKKVDPEGHYVRRWVPELKHLPIEYIHCPWEAPCACLVSANVLLSMSYPKRVIEDLMKARQGHARNVIHVRQCFPETVQPDGHEILKVNGEQISVRVRDDLKDNSEKITLVMTPDEAHSVQRRRIVHKGIQNIMLFEESKKYAAAHEAWDAL